MRIFTLSLLSILLLQSTTITAQATGDTLTVQAFNYNSTTRDTIISFPDDPTLEFERIIMLYSMRCKDGLVSTGTNRNRGCGEWDYSCNTYLHDSSHVDSTWSTFPSHVISGFSGTAFDYVTQPYYDLYAYTQTSVSQTITSEKVSKVDSGTLTLNAALATNQKSGRSQYLLRATELTAAGVDSGNVDGLMADAQGTGNAQFLRVRLKATSDSVLNNSSVDTSGFTTVYFSNYNFTSGANRIQFFTPFVWDGTSNLLVELSFTNSVPGSALLLNGASQSYTSGVQANNQHHVSTASGSYFTVPTSNLTGISNEITISFWARGDAGASTTKTFAFYGVDANGNRTASVHLPWSNTNIYWDCGNTGGSYDRINKLAAVNQVEGSWNHYAFTKNATSGEMKIYINGVLFHSGTGKNRPIQISQLAFGANLSGVNIYRGDLDEIRIWKKELTQTEISDWMYKSVDSSHPKYSEMVAYYPLDEGSGNTTADLATGTLNASFNGAALWKFERGRSISSFFTETTSRPNFSLLQGNYTLTLTPVTVHDSLQATPKQVNEYQIFPKYGTLSNDSIGLTNQYTYWLATNKYVYDGLTGSVISTTPISKDGTINITDLNYLRRWPSRFEIMSFVTPYGIGLDLGMGGKTWAFDLTDFTPVLKGNKRITMERGGQWQEDIDIKFLYIVGTPPRDVMDIQQIWGVGYESYTKINANTVFEPRDVPLNANASGFKIRSAITGHGQEGEFIPRNHFVNLDGGNPEYTWQVWKECAMNPVYPQGGTWIYDRAGWCPGMATDLIENEITFLVTPGQSVNIDYGMSGATGTSNYIVSHQLVSYGTPNFALDAAVREIINPTNRIEYQRTASICDGPIVRIENTGSNALTSLKITYWANNNTNKEVYNWTGTLGFGEKEDVKLPVGNLWEGLSGTAINVMNVEVSEPNGGTDEYSYNNKVYTDFDLPEVFPNKILFEFKTNNAAFENSYTLRDAYGNVIVNRSSFSNGTSYYDTLDLADGCYTLQLDDSGDDGISFWANNDGHGWFRVFNGQNFFPIGVIEPDFGGSTSLTFTVNYPLSYEELHRESMLNVYPNPSNGNFTVSAQAQHAANWKLRVSAIDGKLIWQDEVEAINELNENIQLPACAPGMYFLEIQHGDDIQVKKIIVDQ